MPWACVWHLKTVPLVRNLNGASDRKLNSRCLKIKKVHICNLRAQRWNWDMASSIVWSCVMWICFLLSLMAAPLASFSSSTTWRQARWRPAFLKPTSFRLKYSRKEGKFSSRSSSQSLIDSHWLQLGHMPIHEPIIITKKTQSFYWSDLG